MIIKLWTMKQLKIMDELTEKGIIPENVNEQIKQIVQILDEHYGTDRETGNEDGGCVLIVLGEEEERLDNYKQILTEYKLDTELVEFKDIICKQNNLQWYLELYLLTEYGINIIYAEKEDSKE